MIQQYQNFKRSFSVFAFQTRRLSSLFTTKRRSASNSIFLFDRTSALKRWIDLVLGIHDFIGETQGQ